MSEQHPSGAKAPGLPEIDILEYGGRKNGERQVCSERLFMQLLIVDGVSASRNDVERALETELSCGVLYQDMTDPRSYAILLWDKNPANILEGATRWLGTSALNGSSVRRDWTMLGRTYSNGHEPELAYSLLQRPIDNVLRDGQDWAVWYPLRRKGSFEQLDHQTQAGILREHAAIGMAYGQKDLAHDVRLACHGLDQSDNEFVIGLIGSELHPLSHVVQTMRKTRQTSEFIEKMGPFFVGHVCYRKKAAT